MRSSVVKAPSVCKAVFANSMNDMTKRRSIQTMLNHRTGKARCVTVTTASIDRHLKTTRSGVRSGAFTGRPSM
eukprot:11981474-Heterocapsa_arctica.AAC.1